MYLKEDHKNWNIHIHDILASSEFGTSLDKIYTLFESIWSTHGFPWLRLLYVQVDQIVSRRKGRKIRSTNINKKQGA